jgi:electron transfer flavoprotein alpha subunit
MMMAKILAFAELRDGRLRGVANEVVSAAAGAAAGLGGTADALVLGGPGAAGGMGGLGTFGATVVRVAADPSLERYQPETFAGTVADVVRSGGYTAVFFPATALGRDLAPRVAALLDVPLAGDVTGIEVEEGRLVLTRPVYSGKAFTRLEVDASPVLATLRPNVFQPVERRAEGREEAVAVTQPQGAVSSFVEFRAASGGNTDVAEASMVVSGGRGLRGPEHWELLQELADSLGSGAALGASRAVVDAGWRPHGEQVGQTGKTVSPKLYFAVGISGAIQHLAGMRTAGTIVAVNRDADAPIFQVADYGIVGDLFEVLPVLSREIRAIRAEG